MTGGAIFLVFFIFFTLATLAVSIPLFPGNIVQSMFTSLGIQIPLDSSLLYAMANGMLCSFTIWIAYVLISRKLRQPNTVTSLRDDAYPSKDSVHCPVHFAYLRKLPPGSSILEECWSCPRLEQCASG